MSVTDQQYTTDLSGVVTNNFITYTTPLINTDNTVYYHPDNDNNIIYYDPKYKPLTTTNITWTLDGVIPDSFSDVLSKAKLLKSKDLDSMILELIRFKNVMGCNEIGE